MNGQSVKNDLLNNVIIKMTHVLTQDALQMLEQVMTQEFINVNMERISTLPVERRDSVDEKNRYILQLFLYKKKGLAEGTKYGYIAAVRRLVTLIYKPLTDIDKMDIAYYLNWYEAKNLSATGRKNQATTINNERRFLSAFYTWMRKEKLILDNPVEGVEPLKTYKKPIDYFSAEEMEKLRDGCRTLRERAMIEVFRSTGARVGELVAVTMDMIDWITGDIMICGEKGGRFRPIYLDEEARYHLKKYLAARHDGNPSLFVQSRMPYGTISKAGVRLILKGIACRAGLTCRVYPHKLRKTLGMDLKNKGVDIGIIQEVMGHASPAVTALYYAQSTPETLRSVRKRVA